MHPPSCAACRGCQAFDRVRTTFVPEREASRPMAEPNARDTKLIQYLNEAYGKEKELETVARGPHRHDHAAAVQEAPPGASEGDQGTRAAAQDAHQRARRQGRGRAGHGGPDAGRGGGVDAHVRGQQGRGRGAGPAARDPRHRRVREDAEEREDRVPQRVRGDRDLHRHRGARRRGQRQGHGQARPRHPPRGGADGEVPREADPAAREGGGARRRSRRPSVATASRGQLAALARRAGAQLVERLERASGLVARERSARRRARDRARRTTRSTRGIEPSRSTRIVRVDSASGSSAKRSAADPVGSQPVALRVEARSK